MSSHDDAFEIFGQVTPPSQSVSRSSAAVPTFSMTALRGANLFSRRSVVKVAIEGWATRPVDPAGISDAARQLGIPAPELNGAESTPGRAAEAIVDAIRRHLHLWPRDIDRSQCADLEFVVTFEPEPLAPAIVELAAGLLTNSPRVVLERRLQKLTDLQERLFVNVHIKALGKECRRRDLAWRRLSWGGILHQIGEGKRQCRIETTVTSRTNRLATGIASDKAQSNKLLAQFGVPVPRQAVVRSAEAAWSAAQAIGLPVVVKPNRGNQGKGVGINLRDAGDVARAFKAASHYGPNVLVEKQIQGADHRVLVAYGQLVAVAKRIPAHAMGDGVRTVRALLDEENRNPNRSPTQRHTLMKTIEINDEMHRRLASQNLDLDSVPPAGDIVYFRYGGNISQGATTIDVTDVVHPENARMLIEATALVGLDISGIDFLTADITVPWSENGAAICEVNSKVGFAAHMVADLATGKNVMVRFVDALYREPNGGRLPTVVVYGGAAAAVDRLADELSRDLGVMAGSVFAGAVTIGGVARPIRPASLGEAHQMMIEHPELELVVLGVEPGRIDAEGVGVSHADVVCIAQSGAEPLPAAHAAVLNRTGATFVRTTDPVAIAAVLRERGALA